MLKRIGDECGGFAAVDEDTDYLTKLQWAQILVKRAVRVLLYSSCCGVGVLFLSFMVGDSTLFPVGGADGKKLWGGCFKGRKRRGGKFTCCLLWESKVEGGAIELATWGTGCVVS